jgi:hypothetical protein
MGETYIAPGQYVWDVTLEGGQPRQVLSRGLPVGTYAMPVISAVRGAAYVEGAKRTVGSLNPASAAVGSANFTLHVIGTGFQASDVILWNGSPVATVRVSATELTTAINMAGQTARPIPVAVRTLSGDESNAVTFTVT